MLATVLHLRELSLHRPVLVTSRFRGEAILPLSRLIRETLDKLPFPADVAVSIDVDPYQRL